MENHNVADQLIIESLTRRVELLQAKIQELMEQQQELQNQINHYKNLLRQYRAVMEAEQLGHQYQPSKSIEAEIKETFKILTTTQPPSTVAEAVRQVMFQHKGEPLRVSQVFNLIEKQYPDLKGRVRVDSIYGAVTYALHRGVKEGLWKKVRSGIYEA